jgi:hypothetical protein
VRIATMEPPRVEAPDDCGSTRAPRSADSADGLNAFAAEGAPDDRAHERIRALFRPVITGAAIAVVGIAIGAAAAVLYQKRFSSVPGPASLTIETVPSGLEVTIDGATRGRTPLTLSLPPRAYEAVIGSGTNRRTLKASLDAGQAMVQRLELTAASGPTHATDGTLHIDTDPPGVAIKVDGVERGTSPVTLQNVASGEHDIALARGREHRTVIVHSGETLSALLPASAGGQPGVVAGWLSVAASIQLQIREGGKLLGSTESERILIAAGNHTVDFVNTELGFSQQRTLDVTSGKVTAVQVMVPNGTLSLNAQPWAEVWVDGTRVGETPIGNLARPIGSHEVVFRHPDLGERRETVVVTTLQTARLGVDLRRRSQ